VRTRSGQPLKMLFTESISDPVRRETSWRAHPSRYLRGCCGSGWSSPAACPEH